MRMKHLETVINSGLFSHISKSEYIDAFEHLEIIEKKLASGETIFHTGDRIESICIVEKGSLRGEKTYSSGELHIVSIYDEGSIFALEVAASRKKTSPIDIISNENSTFISISLHSIENCKYRNSFQLALLEMLSDDMIRTMNKVEILVQRGLRERILVYLDILSRKSGTDKVMVRMNREQLSQFLCVNRSALSNELNKMKREGIIDFKGHEFRLLEHDK